ncbi:hypothetical protein M758_3G209000 [Ceratodon purpureus]|nr:hypothetical protein M758_3G209000 [Ceratodon purpureus]
MGRAAVNTLYQGSSTSRPSCRIPIPERCRGGFLLGKLLLRLWLRDVSLDLCRRGCEAFGLPTSTAESFQLSADCRHGALLWRFWTQFFVQVCSFRFGSLELARHWAYFFFSDSSMSYPLPAESIPGALF